MAIFGQQYVSMRLGGGAHPPAYDVTEEPLGCAMEWVALLTQVRPWVDRHWWLQTDPAILRGMVIMDGFTDSPSCVSHLLRSAVIRLNDSLREEERQQLIPYLRRVINTAYSAPPFGSLAEKALQALVREFGYESSEDPVDRRLQMFSELLDEFDRITGHVPMPVEEWEALLEAKMVKIG